MKPKQRQQEIISRLRAVKKALSVEELSLTFGTSPLTIRRDLDALESEGVILRTMGGCVIRTGLESVFQQRLASNFHLKEAIGRAAAQKVQKEEVLLIDDGSTTFHVAANLSEHAPFSIYTNSIAIIPELARYPNVRLHLLGGEYNPDTNFLGGGITERTLELLDFDAVFVGCDAIDDAGRCLVLNPSVARVAEVMIRRGRRKYLLADHTKVGAHSYVVCAKLNDFDAWITTIGIRPPQLDFFRRLTSIEEVSAARDRNSGEETEEE